jgi:hypothetical protein
MEGDSRGRASLRELSLEDSREDGGDDAVAARTEEAERFRRGDVHLLGEVAPQRRTRAREARFHRVLAQLEDRGDFGGVQAFDLAEHEHFAGAIRQPVDGALEQSPQLAGERLPLGIGRAAGIHRRLLARRPIGHESGETGTPAETCERLVDRDPGQPRRKLRATIELPKVRVGIHVGLLHHVFSLAFVADDGTRGPVDAFVVTAHEDLEQGGLSADNPVDDLFVRKRLPLVEHTAINEVHHESFSRQAKPALVRIEYQAGKR